MRLFLVFSLHFLLVILTSFWSKKKSFLDGSVERNKDIIKRQQQKFKEIITQDTLLNYKPSATGFWYAHIATSNNRVLPKRGDMVQFHYKIEDLSGNLLYDEMELGRVRYLVDKEELLPALREAVKVLSVNEVATFLFPSYLCYGYQGDDEKIKINQPLRFTIKLISHSIKN